MKRRYVIGIDVGTTTIKAVFVDAVQNRIATVQTKEIYPTKAACKDYIEYDPNDWIACVKEVLHAGFATGIDPDEVAGINIVDFTVMAFLVDEHGKPLTNAVHYNDMRHLGLLAEVEAKVGDLCVRHGANHVGMYMGVVKQYWWKKEHPDLYDQAAYFMTGTSWIAYLLTGVWTFNRSTAGFYGNYNAHTREWDQEINGKLGLDADKFPPLIDAWEVVGTVTAEAAEAWGLSEGIRVFGGMDDASPVALTCGTLSNGDCYISAGSAANVVFISDRVMEHSTAMSYPHCIPDLNIMAAVLTCTGLSLKWVRNHLGALETGMEKLTGEDAYDILCREAATSPPGANGLIFLPYLDGDYTPNNDPHARGGFVGLSTTTTKADMVRAVLEGVGYSFMSSLKMIRELGGNPHSLAIAGGVAKSSLWLQIIADITGMPISLPNETQGAPLGCALVAAVGCGFYQSFQDAVDRTIDIEKNAYLPNPETHQRYEHLFAIYDRLYGMLKPAFDGLAAFRAAYMR